jgi:succinate dehydrogenase/fumarate reductase cytochrome b subunit
MSPKSGHHPLASIACDNARHNGRNRAPAEVVMSDSLKTLLIVGFLILILWNLGAGLYYMLVDKGQTKRTVNALTKRIALSVALILLLILAIYMGWVEPHGVGRNPAG